MGKINKIEIHISGPSSSGKSSILQTLKKHLEEKHNLACIVPERAERLNPSNDMDSAAPHEKPGKDNTVVVFSEGPESVIKTELQDVVKVLRKLRGPAKPADIIGFHAEKLIFELERKIERMRQAG